MFTGGSDGVENPLGAQSLWASSFEFRVLSSEL
jgi:hypothetical protein